MKVSLCCVAACDLASIHSKLGAPAPEAFLLNSERTPVIGHRSLRRALICGVHCVLGHRDYLNKINVFPVPDGDTGNNLAFSLNGLLEGSLRQRHASVATLFDALADQAVDRARGNSGAIFAQFLIGVAQQMRAQARIDLSAMSRAIDSGARAARRAMAEPKEGTMLSVMTARADSLKTAPTDRGISAWWQHGLEQTQAALNHTQYQLPELSRAGVVDAGAAGFVDFLLGVSRFIGSRQIDPQANARMLADSDFQAQDMHGPDDCCEHRFCTECLVSGEAIDPDAIRSLLAALPLSSLVVAGNERRVRVHAHIDQPAQLFSVLAPLGLLTQAKADDMHAQAHSVRSKSAIAIVTDTSADLPEPLSTGLNVHRVALRLNVGDQDFLDKVSITPSEFYHRVRSSAIMPRTSQPPAGDYRRLFEFLLAHHQHVIYVGLSRAVSGTLQAGETAAGKVSAERISVFDSKNAAGGQALLTLYAAKIAGSEQDPQRILDALQRARPLVQTFAIARDIDYAVRGGRIPRWSGPVVKFLGVTPLAKVSAEGRLKLLRAFFGRRNIPVRFAKFLAKQTQHHGQWRIIVGHCDAPDDGHELLCELRQRINCVDSWLVDTGAAVGAHAGPGALTVSMMPVMENASAGWDAADD